MNHVLRKKKKVRTSSSTLYVLHFHPCVLIDAMKLRSSVLILIFQQAATRVQSKISIKQISFSSEVLHLSKQTKRCFYQ